MSCDTNYLVVDSLVMFGGFLDQADNKWIMIMDLPQVDFGFIVN
jgi:hypothetical protein